MSDLLQRLRTLANYLPEQASIFREAADEIERLQAAKKRALDLANERGKEANMLRMALEKISGRRECVSADHEAAARYKPEDGLWTNDEYLADSALDGISQSDQQDTKP